MSKFTNSPLVVYTKISPNKTSPRNKPIDTITIHCMAGNLSVETCGNVFAPKERQASSNYGIGSDGRIAMYVEEKDRSWCTSSSANDNRAVTIEVANTEAKHPWPVSEKAMAALIDLCTDICKRNGIKELVWRPDKNNPGNMTVHRWYANKACPGDYLYERHGYIAAEVNKRLGATPTTPEKPVTPPAKSDDFKVGDTVQFAGGAVFTSAGAATASTTRPASRCKVTATHKGKNPYHLISEDGKGVYGWAEAKSVTALNAAPPPKTPEEITVDNAIADGIITDKNHWLGVLQGTVTANKANVKALMDNAHNKIKK